MTVDVVGEKEVTTGFGTDKKCDAHTQLCISKKGKLRIFHLPTHHYLTDNVLNILDEARVQIEGTVKRNAQRLEFRDDGTPASAGAENTLFKRGDTGTLKKIITDKT